MVIDGLSRKEIKKLRETQTRRPNSNRKKRPTTLSDKMTEKVFKKFDQEHDPDVHISNDVNIDEHVKMNDSYMRTGWYVPKKK